MRKSSFIFLFILFILSSQPLSSAIVPNITGYLETVNNNIIVNISLANMSELETTIKSGIEKEIVFTIELIREWKFWPDEFVVSKEIKKTVKYDNLRDQYWTSSFDGITRTDKKFKTYDAMRYSIFNVDAVNLANVRGLEPAHYYIRIIVESRSIEQLPIMGLLTHLVPEIDMTLARESDPFVIGDEK